MPTGAFKWFGPAVEALARGTVDFDGQAFRMVLVTSAWTPAQATVDEWADISANEVASGNGYSTHGRAITVTVARSGLVVTIDCGDVSWPSSTFTAKYAVIVRDADSNGALAAADLPICYVDLETAGGSVSVTNGELLVTTASGILTMTAAA